MTAVGAVPAAAVATAAAAGALVNMIPSPSAPAAGGQGAGEQQQLVLARSNNNSFVSVGSEFAGDGDDVSAGPGQLLRARSFGSPPLPPPSITRPVHTSHSQSELLRAYSSDSATSPAASCSPASRLTHILIPVGAAQAGGVQLEAVVRAELSRAEGAYAEVARLRRELAATTAALRWQEDARADAEARASAAETMLATAAAAAGDGEVVSQEQFD